MGAFLISPLPHSRRKNRQSAGPLRSTGVTPLRATTDPSAIPPPSAHFPLRVIGPTSLHRSFSGGREGLLQLPGDALLPCCRFHPAQAPPLISWLEPERCCLRLLKTGSALRSVNNEATFAFTHRCGPEARSPHLVGLCRWAPRSRSPSTSPSKLRGHQPLPRRDSHPIVITCLNLDTLSGLTPPHPPLWSADATSARSRRRRGLAEAPRSVR